MIIGIDARHLIGEKGGIGYYVENLVKSMTRCFEEVEFILFIHKKLKDDFLSPRIKIEELKIPIYGKFISPIWLNFYLPIFLKKYNIDILHCPNFFAPIFLKTKLIITIHDLAPLYFPESFSKFYSIYFKTLLTYSIKRADAIITPTKTIKEEVEENFPYAKGKVFYGYHGIEEIFEPDPDKKYKDFPYILYVGALEKRKNIVTLIKSFHILKEKYKVPHYLILVGKKGYGWSEIKKEIERSPYKNFIIHKGYLERENLVKIYQNADVFVFPSLYEGFGFPVLEAMKCGVPVVISNNKALIEVTKGEGIVVNPLDCEEIAKKIYMILSDSIMSKKLIGRGIKVASEYTWEKNAIFMYEIYKSLLN